MGILVNKKAEALIFDLDGTLSDSLPVHVETWNKIGEKYGFTFDPQIVYELTGRPTIEFAKRIVERYHLNEKPENIVSLKQELFWDMAHLLVPVDEVVAIVKQYSGKLPMSVGTGASRTSADLQLKSLGIGKYFDFVVTANDVQKHKPHPETFLKCAQLMGIEPEKCQVFEDGDLGITAAKQAGMMVLDVRPFINYGKWVHS
jgi:beta-phosphoglucomutase family hydrolase